MRGQVRNLPPYIIMKTKTILRLNILNQPDNRVFLNSECKTTLKIRLAGFSSSDDLTIDLYPVENPQHPDRHYGYWVFKDLVTGDFTISLDFSRIGGSSVNLIQKDQTIKPVHTWINSQISIDPVLDLQIVIRRRKKIIRLVHLNLISGESGQLEDFYHKGEGGAYHIDTFNQIFHAERLRILNKLFKRYLTPQSRVLDAGSGRGIFYLLNNPFKHSVFCLDLNFEGFSPRQGDLNVFYIQGSLFSFPFADETFDMIFSGEVFEHLPDPESTLNRFYQLLRPGGILIFTSPNSRRLINRVRGYSAPLSREHINERSRKEWLTALRETNFEIISTKGIYLELLLTYWKKQKVYDWLRGKEKLSGLKLFTRLLMRTGNLLPSLALDLILIARKGKDKPS